MSSFFVKMKSFCYLVIKKINFNDLKNVSNKTYLGSFELIFLFVVTIYIASLNYSK